eukprot:4941299-Prymnesium_polylepis.1
MSDSFLANAAARCMEATTEAATTEPGRYQTPLYDPAQYPLLAAAEAGDAAAVARLLDTEANVNERTPDGWSALIMASKEGHNETVVQLLMADATINPPQTEMEARDLGIAFLPATHTAIRGAALSGKLDTVKLLLENEADPNITSANGKTPLMGAAMNGHERVVDLLISHGALASVANDFGETARQLAEARGHSAIASVIRAHELAGLNVSSSTGLSIGQAAELLADYLESGAKV